MTLIYHCQVRASRMESLVIVSLLKELSNVNLILTGSKADIKHRMRNLKNSIVE